MSVTIIIFLIIVVFLLIGVSLNIYEKYTSYTDHKTKCFDCETDVIKRCGVKAAWMAQPAKSFDAEREAISQTDGRIEGGFMAKTLKYY